MSLLSIVYTAEINPKLYQGDVTELNIYHSQMKQEIENSIATDETGKERLENEKILLSKIQELVAYKPKSFIIENDFIGKGSITEVEFLELFNHISEILATQTTIRTNQLIIQDKLAFLKNRIENLVESQKENLRLYQLQFAYYKLIQIKDKKLILDTSTIIDEGLNLLRVDIHKVVFNSKKHLLAIEKLDEEIKNIDTKFIALNLTKERELLSSETISTELELKIESNIKKKNKFLQEAFDTLLLLGFYEYQQNNLDMFLAKQKLMKSKLNTFLGENELYQAKYSLIKDLSTKQLESTDYFILTLKEQMQTLYSDLKNHLKEPLFVYDEKPILVGNIFKAILILIFGFIIAKIYHRQFIKLHNRRKDMSTISIKVIANFGFTIIFLISLFIAITNVGLSLANLTVIAGALSIGIGFALRSVVGNYIAGIVIMSEKNIKIGHYIRVDNLYVGKVIDIGLRSTVILTIDNTHIIIPNSDLIEKSVLNLTLDDRIRRIYVPFKIAYGSDIKKVRSLIIKAVNTSNIKLLRDIPGRKPNVWMSKMGDSFIELDLFVWIEGYRPSTKSNLLILIHETLLKHHIKMPYPQLDLHVKKPHDSNLLERNILNSIIKNPKL